MSSKYDEASPEYTHHAATLQMMMDSTKNFNHTIEGFTMPFIVSYIAASDAYRRVYLYYAQSVVG